MHESVAAMKSAAVVHPAGPAAPLLLPVRALRLPVGRGVLPPDVAEPRRRVPPARGRRVLRRARGRAPPEARGESGVRGRGHGARPGAGVQVGAVSGAPGYGLRGRGRAPRGPGDDLHAAAGRALMRMCILPLPPLSILTPCVD